MGDPQKGWFIILILVTTYMMFGDGEGERCLVANQQVFTPGLNGLDPDPGDKAWKKLFLLLCRHGLAYGHMWTCQCPMA